MTPVVRSINERPQRTGSPSGSAGDAHHAAVSLHDGLVAGLVLQGPALAESRDGAVDEPRVQGGQLLVAEAHALHRPRPEVLDQHVGLARHSAQDLRAFLRLEVQGYATLVPIEREKRRRLSPLARHPGARLVTAVDALYLCNVGAHVGEEHGAVGSGQDPREIEDLHPVERQGHVRRSTLRRKNVPPRSSVYDSLANPWPPSRRGFRNLPA